MSRGMEIKKWLMTTVLLIAGIGTIGFMQSCFEPVPYQSYTKPPGIYGLTGWNGAWTPRTLDGVAQAGSVDINGEVGHPLYVDGARTNCVTSNGERQPWTAEHRIISGSLPPGLDFEAGGSKISGIPTERGHWVVTLKLENIQCGDLTWSDGFPQQLRFHITGTGRVVQ